MVLYKLEDFDKDYQDAVGRDEIKGLDVYTDKDDEKVGIVKNILVNEASRFRYLVVDTGFWIFGKQVLLAVDRTRIFPNSKRVYAQKAIGSVTRAFGENDFLQDESQQTVSDTKQATHTLHLRNKQYKIVVSF